MRLLDMVGEAVEGDRLEAELALDEAGVVRVVRIGATLHHLSRNTVLRIRDVYPESRNRLFPSRILDPNCFHPGSRIRIKEFKNLNPKKWFLPIPDPDPGVQKAPDPGSGSVTLQKYNTKLVRLYNASGR